MVSNRTEVNIEINIPYTEIKNMILSWSPKQSETTSLCSFEDCE
jgi:hypothetical protein